MKNLLTLHEAVAIVLLSKPDRAATFTSVADEIERRSLFPERRGGITLTEQIKLRTSISTNKYKHWFEFLKPDIIKLK
jgi:hypothetical protein